MKKSIVLLCTVVAFCAQAQTPNFDWVRMSNGITNPNVYSDLNSHTTVVDTVNQFVYCLGGYDNSINFGTGEFEANGLSNEPSLYLVKYDLGGNLIWAKAYISSRQNIPGGMAIDNSGNLLVCGYSIADTVRFGNAFLVNGDPENSAHNLAYIAKIDGNGNTVWLKGSNNAGGGVRCLSVATDASGNIFATGMVDDATGTFCGNSLQSGLFVTKLNASGNSQWFKQASLNNFATGYAVTTDGNGDCIVAGAHVQPFTVGSFTVSFNVGSSFLDRFITKLDGNTGNYLWAFGEGIWQGPDWAYNVRTDGQNNIYVSGMENIAPDPMVTTTADYAFLEKRDANGALVWHKSYRAFAVNTIYPTLLTDHINTKTGETYALFLVNDSTDIGGTIVSSVPANFNSSVIAAVAKYDTDGNVDWVKSTSDNNWLSYSSGYSIALDQAENCYFTGLLSGSINFDGYMETTQDQNYKEFFLAKLGTNPLGINELEQAASFALYPNPAENMLYIDCSDAIQTVTIFNLTGEKIYTGNQKTIDVSGIAPGMYIVSLTNSRGTSERQLAIK